MTANLRSRFRPWSDPASASIYETIREHDEQGEGTDEETSPVLSRYQDAVSTGAGPQNRAAERGRSGQPAGRGATKHPQQAVQDAARPSTSRIHHPRTSRRGVADLDEAEDDVPASLLIEDAGQPDAMSTLGPRTRDQLRPPMHHAWQSPSPVRPPWPQGTPRRPTMGTNTMATADAKEKAMWRWANVENVDNFLADVYDYFLLKGYWSIVLRRLLNLLTVAFVIGFSLFLTQCIDYARVKGSTSLAEILVRKCTARMGFVPNLILWLTTFICIMRCFQYLLDLRRLNRFHDFFLHLLDIPESEIQSISWQEVVGRLMALRDSNPNIRPAASPQVRRFLVTQSKQRLDAHDIANRLMRKDNYMIAMINKDVLDTTLPLPLLGNRQFLTRTLEWHLNYCIMDYVFNSQGQLRQLFLKDTHRKALSEGLRRRFIFAGATSLIFAPILIIYFILQNFFQYFNEYQKDPAQIGSRQYNTFAKWKFREFNELHHLFERRLKMSYPFASRYINQFPKDKTVQAARFVTFVSGAIISVLGLATILDQENFLGFEITSGRTTIFYLGVVGSIWAVARGMLPEENMIFDSSYSMEEVIEFTHYKPAHWEGRLHAVEVKAEFSQLYQMQIVVLLEEILSMIFTPFVLWFSLPKCSERIIDFFRDFTVHVDGLGYVCSFAEFNFKKPGQIGTGGNAGTRASNPTAIASKAREEYFAAKDDKLERSYWGFINDYTRNPKADVRFPYHPNSRGKVFNHPPPFPGLLSPTLPHQPYAPQDGSSKVGERPSTRPPTARPGEDSIVQSLLLDPHHLPGNASIAMASPPSLRPKRAAARSKMLPGLADTIISTAVQEEDEDVQDPVQTVEPTAASQTGQSGGDLGSWKYEDDLEGDSEDPEDPNALAYGGGVLGLIRQFQRAHDDDKRGATDV